MKNTKALLARVPRFAFGTVARDWFGGHRTATHVSNAMHLLFPAGERFFVRSVLHYESALPPELAAQVKGFCRQEGRHAQAHERFSDNLRSQGHDIDAILERYERLAFGIYEKRASPALRLAITAALEHFTALFAADALSSDALGESDPEMRKLLEWHAVEELEHKAVAFDILRAVAPGYALRMYGLALATLGLGYFWASAARALLANDGIGLRDALRDLRSGDTPPLIELGAVVAGVRAYMRPDFHPDDIDHAELIAATLGRLDSEGLFTTTSAAA